MPSFKNLTKQLADKDKPKEKFVPLPKSAPHKPITPITPELPATERLGIAKKRGRKPKPVSLQVEKPKKLMENSPTRSDLTEMVRKKYELPDISTYTEEQWKALTPETQKALLRQQQKLLSDPMSLTLKRQEIYADNYLHYMQLSHYDTALAQAVYEWIRNGLRSKTELYQLPDIDSASYYIEAMETSKVKTQEEKDLNEIARAIGYADYFKFKESPEYAEYAKRYNEMLAQTEKTGKNAWTLWDNQPKGLAKLNPKKKR